MAGRGRPPKYDYDTKVKLLDSFHKYIEETEIPIVAEWAVKNGMHRETLYSMCECKDDLAEQFTNAIKTCTYKKESELERMALNGEVDRTMAIFSLKQLGWRDKTETENTQKVVFINEEDAAL